MNESNENNYSKKNNIFKSLMNLWYKYNRFVHICVIIIYAIITPICMYEMYQAGEGWSIIFVPFVVAAAISFPYLAFKFFIKIENKIIDYINRKK